MSKSNASQLRDMVTIQKNLPVAVNSANEPVDKWITIRKEFAGVTAGTSREFFSATELQFESMHMVLIRNNPANTTSRNSVTQGCRVLWGDRVLLVEGVVRADNVGRYLKLACVEDTRP